MPIGQFGNNWGSFATLDSSITLLPRRPDRVHYA